MTTNTYKNAGAAIGTSATTVYTCPGSTTAIVNGVYISNIDGVNDAEVTVEVHDSSAATQYKIGLQLPVPTESTLVLDRPINLESNDELRISANATGDVEAFVSVLEIT